MHVPIGKTVTFILEVDAPLSADEQAMLVRLAAMPDGDINWATKATKGSTKEQRGQSPFKGTKGSKKEQRGQSPFQH